MNILSGIERLGETASKVITAVNSKQTVAPAAQPAAPVSTSKASSDWQKYLPWAIGGLVVLLVVGLVFARK